MKRLTGRRSKAAKCCLFCCLFVAVSAIGHGRVKAAETPKGRFCLIVPPERYKPAVETVRSLREYNEVRDVAGSRVFNFFRGQVKKIGFGTPDCFRIEPEEAAALATAGHASNSHEYENNPAEPVSLFPGAGYFNRVSSGGRRGIAFGAGVGQAQAEPHEEYGTPDAKVGIVFGFNF